MSSIPIVGGVLSSVTNGVAKIALDSIAAWILGGTKAALLAVAGVISRATSPDLLAGWFSGTYFRVAGLAALLTVPFLFAAAIQALLRSDLGLLVRAAFFDLPVAVVGVFIAAPLTMLLLAATDEMCGIVSNGGSTAGDALDQMAVGIGGISAVSGSAFLAVLMGVVVALAAIGLMIELLIRAAAVYAVMLMLPLCFAALVWPARRIWAKRIVELLVALILSKFAIVAILSLAAAGIDAASLGSSGTLLVAMTLLVLATFAPWALLKLLPFTELAAGAASMLKSDAASGLGPHTRLAGAAVSPVHDMLRRLDTENAAAAAPESSVAAMLRDGRADPPELGGTGDGPNDPPPGPNPAPPNGPGPAPNPGPAGEPSSPAPDPGPAPEPPPAPSTPSPTAPPPPSSPPPVWAAEDPTTPPRGADDMPILHPVESAGLEVRLGAEPTE